MRSLIYYEGLVNYETYEVRMFMRDKLTFKYEVRVMYYMRD